MTVISEEAVKKLDLTVLERLAEYAEQYDQPDDNGPFPDIQDAMVTVGDLRQARKLLSILSALEPSAARVLALEEAARAAENAALEYNLSECAGLADWAAFEAGQESGLKHAAAAIRALSSPDQADAGKVEGDGWMPIESAPDHEQGPFLVTNNPKAVNAFGRPSHVWCVGSIHKDDDGSFCAFDGYQKIHDLKMFAVVSAPSEGAE